MKILDPGHVYELEWLDGDPKSFQERDSDQQPLEEFGAQNQLIFVKREGDNYPGNVGSHPGTNLQEVLRALIDRVKYLHNQVPDIRNPLVLDHLRLTMFFLEARAAERHGRQLPHFKMNEIELQPTCIDCGHIGCYATCRKEDHGHGPKDR